MTAYSERLPVPRRQYQPLAEPRCRESPEPSPRSATWQLGRAAIVDVPTAALAIAGAVVLFRYRPNSAWLVLGGGVLGLLLGGLR